eukprot:s2085_g1.t1
MLPLLPVLSPWVKTSNEEVFVSWPEEMFVPRAKPVALLSMATLAVDFCSFLFANVYQRLHTVTTGMHSEISDILAAQRPDFPVLSMGDWDEVPRGDASLFHHYVQDGHPVASRWPGDRCVDYVKQINLWNAWT